MSFTLSYIIILIIYNIIIMGINGCILKMKVVDIKKFLIVLQSVKFNITENPGFNII